MVMRMEEWPRQEVEDIVNEPDKVTEKEIESTENTKKKKRKGSNLTKETGKLEKTTPQKQKDRTRKQMRKTYEKTTYKRNCEK